MEYAEEALYAWYEANITGAGAADKITIMKETEDVAFKAAVGFDDLTQAKQKKFFYEDLLALR